MARMEPKYLLAYRVNGDTLDTFGQKYNEEILRIFQFLNDIREHKTTGTETIEPVAGEIKLEDGKLYIRNEDNTEWVTLGKIEAHFGLTAADVGAVKNGGSMGSLSIGTLLERPKNANTNDMYFATDTKELYVYLSDAWQLFCTLNLMKLTGYEEFTSTLVKQDETATAGGTAAKLARTNEDGKLAFDITGDAGTLSGATLAELVKQSETAEKGGTAGVLARTNANGVLDFDVSGNAGKLAGVNVAIDHMTDGQTFVYRAATNTITNEDKGVVGSGKSLILKDGETILADYSGDATVEVDLGTTALNTKVDTTVASLKTEVESSLQKATDTLGYSQVTKLNTITYKGVDIPIKQNADFVRPPISVLKLRDDGITETDTACEFNDGDASDFVANDGVVFAGGIMKPRTTFEIAMTEPTELASGYISNTELIDMTNYKAVKAVDVR